MGCLKCKLVGWGVPNGIKQQDGTINVIIKEAYTKQVVGTWDGTTTVKQPLIMPAEYLCDECYASSITANKVITENGELYYNFN